MSYQRLKKEIEIMDRLILVLEAKIEILKELQIIRKEFFESYINPHSDDKEG